MVGSCSRISTVVQETLSPTGISEVCKIRNFPSQKIENVRISLGEGRAMMSNWGKGDVTYVAVAGRRCSQHGRCQLL